MSSSEPEAEEQAQLAQDITPYRQPMVTSIGIIMGFMFNFLASWAVSDDDSAALQSMGDYLVAGTIFASLLLFTVTLYRLLDNRLTPGQEGARYQATFRIYLTAIALGFAGLTIALAI